MKKFIALVILLIALAFTASAAIGTTKHVYLVGATTDDYLEVGYIDPVIACDLIGATLDEGLIKKGVLLIRKGDRIYQQECDKGQYPFIPIRKFCDTFGLKIAEQSFEAGKPVCNKSFAIAIVLQNGTYVHFSFLCDFIVREYRQGLAGGVVYNLADEKYTVNGLFINDDTNSLLDNGSWALLDYCPVAMNDEEWDVFTIRATDEDGNDTSIRAKELWYRDGWDIMTRADREKSDKEWEDNRARMAREQTINEIQQRHPKWERRYIENAVDGNILVGMPADLVVVAWGYPDKKTDTVNSQGVKLVQWTYTGQSTYIYFSNGVVHSWKSF